MESVTKTFISYLRENGLLHPTKENLFFNQIVQVSNDDLNESVLISVLEEYIKSNLINKRELLKYIKNLYEKFVMIDDTSILKTFRKIFIIYQNNNKRQKLIYFNRWLFKKKYILLRNKLTRNIIKEEYDKGYQLTDLNQSTKQELNKTTKITQVSTKNLTETKSSPIINQTINKTQASESMFKISEAEDSRTLNVKRNINIPKPNRKADIDLFDRLHRDKELRDLKKKEMEKRSKDRDVMECTFTPKIKKIKVFQSLENSPKVPIYEKLYKKKEQLEEKKKYLSVETEEKYSTECPFKPNLCSNKKIKSDKLNLSFKERVKYYKENKNKKIKKLKDMYQYTYTPTEQNRTINESKSYSHFDRKEKLQNYHKEKKEKLRKIEADIMIQNGITFKPKLNENSLISVDDNIINRNKEFIKNRDIKIKSYIRSDDLECTFSPKILTQQHPAHDEDLPVNERLYNYNQVYKEKKENFKENFKEFYSFKPEINKNTDEILRRKKELLDEIKDKFDTKKKIANERNYTHEETEENCNDQEENYINDHKKRIKWKNEINLLTENNITEEKEETERAEENYNTGEKVETPKLNEEQNSIIETENKNSVEKHKDSMINIENKMLKVSQDSKNKMNQTEYNHTFSAKQQGYDLLDKNYYSKLTDQQLLSLANNIMSPDTSLDKFQYKYKNNRYKDEILKVYEDDMKRDFKLKKSIESMKKSKEINSPKMMISESPANNKNLPLNVKKAMEYYNQLNN